TTQKPLANSLVVVAVVVEMIAVVGVVVPHPMAFTDFFVNACASKIEFSIHLVLVLHKHIGTDSGMGFEIAAASEVGGVVNVAASLVDRGLGIGAEGTRAAGGRRGRAAGCQQQVRSFSVFHPLHQGPESIHRTWAGSAPAMGNSGCTKQAIEILNVLEMRHVAGAVTRGHLAIVVDNATGVYELIIAAHPGDHLAAVGFESVKWSERVGHVRDVARTVLRDLGIAC